MNIIASSHLYQVLRKPGGQSPMFEVSSPKNLGLLVCCKQGVTHPSSLPPEDFGSYMFRLVEARLLRCIGKMLFG